MTRLLDPFEDPVRDALAHPWRALADLVALVVIVAVLLALVVLAWAAMP